MPHTEGARSQQAIGDGAHMVRTVPKTCACPNRAIETRNTATKICLRKTTSTNDADAIAIE